MDPQHPQLTFETRAARVGEWRPPTTPSLVEPIYQSTVYKFTGLDQVDAVQEGRETGYIYYRNGTPNHTTLESAIAGLEGAAAAVVGASGMAVISGMFLSLLRPGDHVLCDRVVYGGTYNLLSKELPALGIETSLVDATDLAAVAASIRPGTRLLHVEAISNPMMQVVDLPALIALAQRHNILLSVDATFATPYLLRPVEMGADLVCHSLPKYLGGHSAAMGGVISGRAELINIIRSKLSLYGATLAPFDAWMALQGLKTLALRMRAHSDNGAYVAQFLARHSWRGHPSVMRVIYPGLPHHQQHTLAQRLFPQGFGGMLSFEVPGGRSGADAFLRALSAIGSISFSPSLADVSTTVSYPAGTSHRLLSEAQRAAIGVTPGLIRLSVGIEDKEDICADLDRALAAMPNPIQAQHNT
ncbi:MAG: aminotransferase class I/II-fold pyridoxal phosphate-dependent enzyme [Chloroflexi bacterium]|nr:aminotransferase class I/II-fold pyridoxal phosphate-dependent enzyme [Chloroflexota bacterium]